MGLEISQWKRKIENGFKQRLGKKTETAKAYEIVPLLGNKLKDAKRVPLFVFLLKALLFGPDYPIPVTISGFCFLSEQGMDGMRRQL